MASTATRPKNPDDEVLAVLRQLGSVLPRIATKDDLATLATKDEIARLATKEELNQAVAKLATKEEVAKLATELTDTRATMMKELTRTTVEIAEIRGQLKYMPTLWTLAALVFAIFGAAFVLLRLPLR